LLHHFSYREDEVTPEEVIKVRRPLVTSRPVASSDVLVKSATELQQWQESARSVAAVEMELGGVYEAARQAHKQYPVLAIRGISDVVGYKRDDEWTKYACNTAAAFAVALLRSEASFEIGQN
jgi:nucleoside phosphorylase